MEDRMSGTAELVANDPAISVEGVGIPDLVQGIHTIRIRVNSRLLSLGSMSRLEQKLCAFFVSSYP